MSRKPSFGSRRSSAVDSIISSASSVSTVAPVNPKVKVFSPDGTNRSSKIRVEFNDVFVTLSERGQRDLTRTLRLVYSATDEDNKNKMGLWHCSMVDATDRDPAGINNLRWHTDKQSVDPGHLPYLYKNHLNCLEVLTGPETSGKWMIRPIAIEKRQAIHKAIQDAKTNKKQVQTEQALSLLKLAEEEERLEKARLERQARRKVRAEEAALRKQAEARQHRQNSTDSLGSMYKNKGARVSVTSLASTQTSSTVPRYPTHDTQASGDKKKHKSLRHMMFRKDKKG